MNSFFSLFGFVLCMLCFFFEEGNSVPCELAFSCDDCLLNTTCGWCDSTSIGGCTVPNDIYPGSPFSNKVLCGIAAGSGQGWVDTNTGSCALNLQTVCSDYIGCDECLNSVLSATLGCGFCSGGSLGGCVGSSIVCGAAGGNWEETACPCIGSCSGRECGDDGCGLPCGSNQGNCTIPSENCLANGTCSNCVASEPCGNKECGIDDCGFPCGECQGAQSFCDVNQTCGCLAACIPTSCGPDGCGGNCACADVSAVCVSETCCTPVCIPNKCASSDGCGGTCQCVGVGDICGYPTPNDCCTPNITCDGSRCGMNDGCGNTCQCDAPIYQNATNSVVCYSGMCCIPQTCDNTICGDDGCGGVCSCNGAPTDTCISNICVPSTSSSSSWNKKSTSLNTEKTSTTQCVPKCLGSVCGSDSCGGSCGSCGGNQICTAGQCANPCVPNCTEKECGDDGCGTGFCGLKQGNCELGFTCANAKCEKIASSGQIHNADVATVILLLVLLILE